MASDDHCRTPDDWSEAQGQRQSRSSSRSQIHNSTYERLGAAKLPLGRVTDYAPPEDGPQRYMGHNEYIVFDAARHRIKYVVQCRAA